MNGSKIKNELVLKSNCLVKITKQLAVKFEKVSDFVLRRQKF